MIRVAKVDCNNYMDCRDMRSDFWGPDRNDQTRLLFEYPWQRKEKHCGLALKDGDQTAGFIGRFPPLDPQLLRVYSPG